MYSPLPLPFCAFLSLDLSLYFLNLPLSAQPSNVLINERKHIHICDFGLCRMLPSPPQLALHEGRAIAVDDRWISDDNDENSPPATIPSAPLQTPLTQYVVTRWYRAPEVCASSGCYGTAQDVWSAACTFFELLTRKVLFPGNSNNHVLSLIVRQMGNPTIPDMAFRMDREMRSYINSQRPSPFPKGPSFAGILPDMLFAPSSAAQTFGVVQRDQLLSMMSGMLSFNPLNRMGAAGCLVSDFLSSEGLSGGPSLKVAGGQGLGEGAVVVPRRVISGASHKVVSAGAGDVGGLLESPTPPPPPLSRPYKSSANTTGSWSSRPPSNTASSISATSFDDIENPLSDRRDLVGLLVAEVGSVQRDLLPERRKKDAAKVPEKGSGQSGKQINTRQQVDPLGWGSSKMHPPEPVSMELQQLAHVQLQPLRHPPSIITTITSVPVAASSKSASTKPAKQQHRPQAQRSLKDKADDPAAREKAARRSSFPFSFSLPSFPAISGFSIARLGSSTWASITSNRTSGSSKIGDSALGAGGETRSDVDQEDACDTMEYVGFGADIESGHLVQSKANVALKTCEVVDDGGGVTTGESEASADSELDLSQKARAGRPDAPVARVAITTQRQRPSSASAKAKEGNDFLYAASTILAPALGKGLEGRSLEVRKGNIKGGVICSSEAEGEFQRTA